MQSLETHMKNVYLHNSRDNLRICVKNATLSDGTYKMEWLKRARMWRKAIKQLTAQEGK